MAKQQEEEKTQYAWLAKLGMFWATSSSTQVPQRFKLALDEFIKQLPPPEPTKWNAYCDDLVKQGYCDQPTADLLKEITKETFPVNILMHWFIPIMLWSRNMNQALDIYGLERQYDMLRETTPNPAPPGDLIAAMILDPDRTTENRAELKKYGYSAAQIDSMVLARYAKTPEEVIRVAYLRGILDDDLLYERMRELGYTDTRIGEIVQTWEVLPGPQDLFWMVGKEAFEPAIYKKIGLADEFPTEQLDWLKKQGISEDWARKYWIAHWEQPSIGQGFEMYHRRVITAEELDILFKAVEIPPFWRDKLTQIAYNPLTRVDVRRMYQLDVLSEEQVYNSYLDFGYSPANAELMTNFTIRFKHEHEQELTRSAILESYHEDLISHSDAKALMVDQGYSDELAEYYLGLEDYHLAKEDQDEKVDLIGDRFLLGLINSTTARSHLTSLGLRGTKIDNLIESWDLNRFKYEAIPTKSELDRFLVKGIIDQGTYRSFMARHGFDSVTISWYLEDLTGDLAEGDQLPTKSELIKWYKGNNITREHFERAMKAHGYSDTYIELYRTT